MFSSRKKIYGNLRNETTKHQNNETKIGSVLNTFPVKIAAAKSQLNSSKFRNIGDFSAIAVKSPAVYMSDLKSPWDRAWNRHLVRGSNRSKIACAVGIVYKKCVRSGKPWWNPR